MHTNSLSLAYKTELLCANCVKERVSRLLSFHFWEGFVCSCSHTNWVHVTQHGSVAWRLAAWFIPQQCDCRWITCASTLQQSAYPCWTGDLSVIVTICGSGKPNTAKNTVYNHWVTRQQIMVELKQRSHKVYKREKVKLTQRIVQKLKYRNKL